MSLSSSLFSGISGLSSLGNAMQIIGDNIANVNTIGFKSSSFSFNDLLSQSISTLSGTSQVGRGTAIGNIFANFEQGSFEATSNTTDMAIGGEGFFRLKDPNSESRYYTRAGNFGFNMDGHLTNAEGMVVQGWALDENGEDVGSVTDIVLQSFTSPPQETDHLEVIVNLDSDGENNTTSSRTRVNCSDGPDTLAAGAAAANAGAAQNAVQGETLTIRDPDGNTVGVPVTVNAGDSVQDISASLNALSGVTASAFAHAVINTGGSTANSDDGTHELSINGVALAEGLDLTDAQAVAAAINASDTLNAKGIYAQADDLLVNVYASNGDDLTFSFTDVGGGAAEAVLDVRGAADNPAAPVTLNSAGTGNDLAVAVGGRLEVVLEKDFTISSSADNQLFSKVGGGITTAALDPDAALAASWDGTADAPISETAYDYQTTTLVYDSLGSTHEVTLYFDKADTASSYEFLVTCNPSEDNRTGAAAAPWAGKLAHGVLTFDTGGAVSDMKMYRIDPYDGSSELQTETDDLTEGYYSFSPEFIAGDPLNIKLDFGNYHNGTKWVSNSLTTTQYASASNTIYESANGFGAGDLENVSVNVDGVITGHYSNGQLIPLYRVALAKFQNTQGLFKEGGNLYSQTNESGEAITNRPGTNGLGNISSSSLEQSNVDIADELVKMITTQRGFQANSKIITVTDSMLNDLINIKR